MNFNPYSQSQFSKHISIENCNAVRPTSVKLNRLFYRGRWLTEASFRNSDWWFLDYLVFCACLGDRCLLTVTSLCHCVFWQVSSGVQSILHLMFGHEFIVSCHSSLLLIIIIRMDDFHDTFLFLFCDFIHGDLWDLTLEHVCHPVHFHRRQSESILRVLRSHFLDCLG